MVKTALNSGPTIMTTLTCSIMMITLKSKQRGYVSLPSLVITRNLANDCCHSKKSSATLICWWKQSKNNQNPLFLSLQSISVFINVIFDDVLCIDCIGRIWNTRGAGGVLPYITYTGMCRPTGSWFWSSWFRTGYPFQRRFLEQGIKNCGSWLYLLLKIVADYEEAFIWCISQSNKEISF